MPDAVQPMDGGLVPVSQVGSEEWETIARRHARVEAWRLFGYHLGGEDNADAVTNALVEIARILFDRGNVEILVWRRSDV